MKTENGIIRNEKPLFPNNLLITGKILLILAPLGILYSIILSKNSTQEFFWLCTVLLFVALILVLSKDEFEFDFAGKSFSNYVKLFDIRMFTATKKLPEKILFVQTVHRRLKWKRYFAAVIAITTHIITYEIYLVSTKGKAAKLTSLDEMEAKEFSAKVAELYGVEWRLKEMV